MSLSSFNSYLLVKLVRNFRLGTDPRSLIKRHQTLSIIYTNFSLLLMTVCFEVISLILGIRYHNLPLVVLPFAIGTFVSLRVGKNDIAAILLMMYVHTANFYISHFCNSSLGALATAIMYPNFIFFMSSSSALQVINAIICAIQICAHIVRFTNVFAVTLTPEQTYEINHVIAVTVPSMGFQCFTLIAQKLVENSIWQSACVTEEKTEKINQEIMQAVEAKDAFISSLSHEIRNPLNAINGSINYLLKVIKDLKSQQMLNNAKISGETLLNLFNNLLDAAKLKSDKMELSYVDTNISETLKKVLIINCENIKHKKISVEVIIDRNIPQTIRSDSARLLQILMNLLSNSLKFTPEGGKITISAQFCPKDQSKEQQLLPINVSRQESDANSIELDESTQISLIHLVDDESSFFEEYTSEEAKTRCENLNKSIRTFKSKTLGNIDDTSGEISCQNQPWSIKRVNMDSEEQDSLILGPQRNEEDRQDYFLKIQVKDTGCGIAEENIPKLFEMFTQAHRSVTSTHGGTGLGLWICKQLCQKMGGDIRLYSELGKGTTFVCCIPITKKKEQTISSCQQEISEQQYQEKVSCLVVDDFSYNRDLYKLLLERDGVQVITASDGEEAINKYMANRGRIDFILMDVQMPKVDGFTAAKRIREMELSSNWKRVDIYFVSGEYYNEQEVMAGFRTQGGNGEEVGIQSLKKPIDIEVMSKVAAKYTKEGR